MLVQYPYHSSALHFGEQECCLCLGDSWHSFRDTILLLMDFWGIGTPSGVGAGEFRWELHNKIQTYESTISYELHRTEIFMTSEFINNNITSLTNEEREARWLGWVQNFTTACGTERDFLGLGITGNFPAYNIVSDGTYMIRSFSNDVYLALVGGTLVITQKIAPQDKGKLHGRSTDATMQWTFTNTTSGYAIQNVAQLLFLSISLTLPMQPVYDITTLADEYPWSINSVWVYSMDRAILAYQWVNDLLAMLQLTTLWQVSRPRKLAFCTWRACQWDHFKGMDTWTIPSYISTHSDPPL